MVPATESSLMGNGDTYVRTHDTKNKDHESLVNMSASLCSDTLRQGCRTCSVSRILNVVIVAVSHLS